MTLMQALEVLQKDTKAASNALVSFQGKTSLASFHLFQKAFARLASDLWQQFDMQHHTIPVHKTDNG